jgi:hypothetical protein
MNSDAEVAMYRRYPVATYLISLGPYYGVYL